MQVSGLARAEAVLPAQHGLLISCKRAQSLSIFLKVEDTVSLGSQCLQWRSLARSPVLDAAANSARILLTSTARKCPQLQKPNRMNHSGTSLSAISESTCMSAGSRRGSMGENSPALYHEIVKISQEMVHAVAPPKAAAGAPDIDSMAFIERQPPNSIASGFVPIFHYRRLALGHP